MKIEWPYEFPGAYWLDQKEEQAVIDVLRDGSLFRYYGLKKPGGVDKLESLSRKFYGAKYALGLNSGTGALSSCLAALDIGPGCEVILPAFMWVASVGVVVQRGAIPVLCEIDESFCMDPDDIERKITARTKLILPIHMAGTPCDMDAIMSIAGKHDIPVLEDCAQCNGGDYKGKKVGTFGKMGIFSLQLNKNMTCGEGGIVITDDKRLYYRLFSVHDMGLIRVDGRLATPEPYAINWGQGRRMAELCGAVAAVQIVKLQSILSSMRSSKNHIMQGLSDVKGLKFRRMNDKAGDTGPFLIIMLPEKDKAISAAEKMKEAGLHNVFRIADYGLHIYYNIPALVEKVPLSSAGDPWKLRENTDSNYDYNKGACPRSDDLFARSIIIPIPSRLTDEQEQLAIDVISKAVGSAK